MSFKMCNIGMLCFYSHVMLHMVVFQSMLHAPCSIFHVAYSIHISQVLIVVVAMTIASKVFNLPSYGVVTLGTMDYGFQPPALPE